MNKRTARNYLIILLVVGSSSALYALMPRTARAPAEPAVPVNSEPGLPLPSTGASPQSRTGAPAPAHDIPAAEVVAENLEIPWSLAWLPDGTILVTERPGRLVMIHTDRTVIPVSGVAHQGEGGLLGLVLHPHFSDNHWLYVYLTSQTITGVTNRVERYTLDGSQLKDRVVLLDNIPGAKNHNGGSLAFGPDGLLYITTGDAGQSQLAQDTAVLAGKILRLRDDGSFPADNPFHNAIYSFGHRNPQGLAWDKRGQLWATEHGRSGVVSGLDEVNKISAGENYGWPAIQGSEQETGMLAPYIQSGASVTWAPAGAAILDDYLYFGGLRGEALYTMPLNGEPTVTPHYAGEFGRIRAVAVGPDNFIYITTSNRDGRGTPESGDDKVIRLNPTEL
ncbi:MAG: glucose sorbosone dehydrogenase [Candidatus Andersenbacteria bacterium CG10_big_fil_rev_8_21_14_0_10_54_11]|uniref:Glucose sorbosone dehydrogenase n=1 Tax=Candidatus Andersenbacteria bacterium CG10_big_fil_rev_8_21_14_0_10_54_11 TaxID=1974485 RepID=A0A2M6WZU9_9BACT|nr:MAG: glucose sorbosone dehydrogenase [Candidatus Andersenbacteria bacterium CG10_big_fil_rev_8_21_14_0_10_54_11]